MRLNNQYHELTADDWIQLLGRDAERLEAVAAAFEKKLEGADAWFAYETFTLWQGGHWSTYQNACALTLKYHISSLKLGAAQLRRVEEERNQP